MGATPAPDPDEAERSDLVVLWSLDAVATNVHFVARAKEARRRGAALWLVDTHENATARIADRVFLVRPGSDGALALGLMHVLARDGLADEAFLSENAAGWAELRERVLPEWTPARTAAATGLPAEGIVEMARSLAAARAPFLRVGSGLSRYGNGAMTVRTIVVLAAVLGAPGRDGGGCLCGTSSSQAFDLAPVTREDLLARPARVVNMNQLGRALGELSGPRVMSLYVYASNPAAVAPDQNAVLRGLAREDLFTVVHERFLTDTARYADVVLPATTSLEHPDLYRSYGHYFLQRVRAAIPPQGEAKPNWETFQLLARAMGFEEPVFRATADQMIDALLARPSPWREGIDRAALEAGRAVGLRMPPGPRWRTPSGRIEILNPAHREPLPRFLPTHEEAGALPLRLQTAPALYSLNSTFGEREDLRARRGGMRLALSPADASARGLGTGDRAIAWNDLGEAEFEVEVAAGVPPGVAVAAGVFWLRDVPGARNVNALTSQRLTDEAGGSTFYDTRVDVRRANVR
jgi:anaerobic selenocysteine-containing dehydrogenase